MIAKMAHARRAATLMLVSVVAAGLSACATAPMQAQSPRRRSTRLSCARSSPCTPDR